MIANELITRFSSLNENELQKELNDRQSKLLCAEVVDLDKLCAEIEAIEYCLNNNNTDSIE